MWYHHLWGTIHTVALKYSMRPSHEEQIQYKNFYESLEFVIPCGGCRFHYGLFLKEFPINLENMESLFAWTVKIHNEVNKLQDKPEISVDDAMKIWKKSYPY